MSSFIRFFPSTLPDETLQSRISRYHQLSGNRTENETFKDIFGAAPFSIGIIPKRVEDLAARLGGDKDTNLNELLKINTILPIYTPFLGLAGNGNNSLRDEKKTISSIGRIPRREVGIHSMAKICLACVRADLMEQGYSYWHRAHHIPGITACWRHGEMLLQSCPECSHPFYRTNKLLPSLAQECVCGWSPLLSNLSLPSVKIEQDFAVFSKQLLDRNLPAIKSEIIATCYSRKSKELGYTAGKLQSKKKMLIGIESHFGEDILAKIDYAYGLGKHHQWIRTTAIGGLLDMPITRHLILVYHLFKTVDHFEDRLAHEALVHQHGRAISRSKNTHDRESVSKRKLFRQKVKMILEMRGIVSLEYLWAHAYQATLWLTTHDKVWLNDALTNGLAKKAAPFTPPDSRDEVYAKTIATGLDDLYLIHAKQTRVNITNMSRLLPNRLPQSTAKRKTRFPLTSKQLKLNLESYWHFQLRRAILAISDISRHKLPANSTSLEMVSSISSISFKALISHFEWDLEKIVKTSFDPEELLKKTGVSHQWEGPPGPQIVAGGRSYVPLTPSTRTEIL